jgi:hypothetical protein
MNDCSQIKGPFAPYPSGGGQGEAPIANEEQKPFYSSLKLIL